MRKLSSGKGGAAAILAVLYFYTGELYPTEIRSTAVGLCSTVGHIAATLAPEVRRVIKDM